MKKRSIVTFAGFLLTALPAAAWHLVPCDATGLARRAAYSAQLRGARPGSPVYAPIPFPKSNADVVTDATEQLVEIYDRPEIKGTTYFRPLAQAVRRGDYKYEVIRVTNWTPGRCAQTGSGSDTYFIVVIRSQSGIEVARVSVGEQGLFREVALVSPSLHVTALTPPNSALATLAAKGIAARDAQYVATTGSLQCDTLRPCVASRNSSGSYIVRGTETYLLSNGGRIFNNELHTPEKQRQFAAGLSADQYWVSIGGDAFVVAKKLQY
jgi:hypothetical protein